MVDTTESEKHAGSTLPEWETTAGFHGEDQNVKKYRPLHGVKTSALGILDRVMPPHRRYCGLQRRYACIIILATCLVSLALILGLAIGLSNRSR